MTLTLFNATTSGGGIRPEIVGQQNDPGSIDFNRIENNLGLRAAWTPYQDLSVSGGYNFAINRGFNDEFTSQDSDQHGFNVGTFLRAHPQVSVGLSAGYSMIRFLESFQNDLDTWSIGPVVSYSPSENLNISAQVGYTVVDSQNNGAVADTNDFSGWTYGGSVSHRINKYLNHAVSGGFSVQPGVGANFSQGYNLGYTLSAQLIQGLGLNASFFWNNFEQSSNGLAFQAIVVNGVVILVPVQLNVSQKADFFNISLGSSYQLTTKLNASLAYTYTARVSDVVLEEFDAHSVGLNLNYQF